MAQYVSSLNYMAFIYLVQFEIRNVLLIVNDENYLCADTYVKSSTLT